MAEREQITPQMIDAGIEAMRTLDYDLWETRFTELGEWVVAIYIAMQKAADVQK